MKIIYNKFIPFKGYLAINLFGVLFVRAEKKHRLTDKTMNHERIHTAQMKELGYIFFYIWYIVEYCVIRLFHSKQSCAYHDVSFEEEAYMNEWNMDYLSSRRHYTWMKFLRTRSNHTHTGNGFCQR